MNNFFILQIIVIIAINSQLILTTSGQCKQFAILSADRKGQEGVSECLNPLISILSKEQKLNFARE